MCQSYLCITRKHPHRWLHKQKKLELLLYIYVYIYVFIINFFSDFLREVSDSVLYYTIYM